MTKDELLARGWDTWYNDDYWVHPKTVTDPTRQDFTNYGMSFEKAVEYELENKPPTPPGFDLGSGFSLLKKLNEIVDRYSANPEEQEASLNDET